MKESLVSHSWPKLDSNCCFPEAFWSLMVLWGIRCPNLIELDYFDWSLIVIKVQWGTTPAIGLNTNGKNHVGMPRQTPCRHLPKGHPTQGIQKRILDFDASTPSACPNLPPAGWWTSHVSVVESNQIEEDRSLVPKTKKIIVGKVLATSVSAMIHMIDSYLHSVICRNLRFAPGILQKRRSFKGSFTRLINVSGCWLRRGFG